MNFREKFYNDYGIRSGALKVWQRNFLYFKKTWLVSLFWIVLEPTIYLGAIGFGLGAFVSNMSGMSYIEFFLPALLCSTAMMVAFFEGTYGAYTKLTHQKTYSTIMLSQVGPEEIVFGELLWSACKGFFGVSGVVLVASFIGLVDSWRIFIVVPILFLTAWVFSSFAMIITSFAKNYDSFIYSTSGIIVPMGLLSGTYFPLEQLPSGLRLIAWLFPLTHAVSAVRLILVGNINWVVIVNILVLIVLAGILTRISIKRLSKRLLN